MILRHSRQILFNFARLVRPKISKYENVFELMRDKQFDLETINQLNNRLLNTTKDTPFRSIVAERLGVSDKIAEQISKTTIKSTVYSPISLKPYRISQTLNEQIKVQDTIDDLQIPYKPGNNHLKYHYSIEKDIPNLQQYKIKKSQIYIFNLSQQANEKQITNHLGYRLINNVKIHYCMLGLPAYAVVEFNSQNDIYQKIMPNNLQFTIGNKTCKVVTYADARKLPLNRRQLVIKNIGGEQTAGDMLLQFSQYGRIMNLNLPTQIYKQPSIQEVKALYKDQKYPVKINYHRMNGTIQSEYYPPYNKNAKLQMDNVEIKQDEYKRRLRYSENIDVYQGKEGQTTVRNKGFCIITFSCQEQAQNCYLQLNHVKKMQLVNEREQFQFDEKHRLALLRHIDNAYLDQYMQGNPRKSQSDYNQKMNSSVMQSIFLSMVTQNYKKRMVKNYAQLATSSNQQIQIFHTYKMFLHQLKQTIGKVNYKQIDSKLEGNLYGKSFDDLAQEELYGFKISQRSKNKRYQVNIDNYLRQASQNLQDLQAKKQLEKLNQQEQREEQQQQQTPQQQMQSLQKNDGRETEATVAQVFSSTDTNQQLVQKRKRRVIQKLQLQQYNHYKGKIKVKKPKTPPASAGGGVTPAKTEKTKKGFSTVKNTAKIYRPKTQQEIIKSHMNYNKFIRDIINQYMGVFPTQKLQAQFYRKKPNIINPQSLKFIDGEQFVTESEVGNVLQFSSKPSQKMYDGIIKQNQIVKSLNIDVQQEVLKDFDDNLSEALFELTDVGVVKQQFTYDGEDIKGKVKQLNMEAQFGEQYRLVQDPQSQTKKIVKIAKIQHIYPMDLVNMCIEQGKKMEKQGNFTPQKIQIIRKYQQYLYNNQPVPDELADILQIERGTILNLQEMMTQICKMKNLNKKDLQKIMNFKNYSQKQLSLDYSIQYQLNKARQRRAKKEASDFSRDPSQIKVKDRNKKSVVSKFRQI